MEGLQGCCSITYTNLLLNFIVIQWISYSRFLKINVISSFNPNILLVNILVSLFIYFSFCKVAITARYLWKYCNFKFCFVFQNMLSNIVKLWIIHYEINHCIQPSNLNFNVMSLQVEIIYFYYHITFPVLYYTLIMFASFKVWLYLYQSTFYISTFSSGV